MENILNELMANVKKQQAQVSASIDLLSALEKIEIACSLQEAQMLAYCAKEKYKKAVANGRD